ncbi:hypothetical protein FRC07_004252 [Ceratobasidium sp. 392]|nr:hypothetical protein FRC07_004252 [Ceratobasidium sp. 392]
MSRPLKYLSREDMYALGPETYRIILLDQEACFQKRLKLVCHLPPIIHAPECLGAKQNRKCEQGYAAALSNLQAEILGTKPPVGLPAHPLSVIGHLLTAANLGLSDERCGLLTLNAIKELKAFEAENLIMNQIICWKRTLKSGWWDGLIGSERGWFLSNFVTVISEAEAEAKLALRRDMDQPVPAPGVVKLDLAQLDASRSDSEWLQDKLEQAAGGEFNLTQFHVPPPPANNMASHDADIWLLQVEPNEQARPPPHEPPRRRRPRRHHHLEPSPPPPQPSLRAPPPPPIARQRANTAMTASSLSGFAFVAHSTTARPQASHQQRSGVSLQKPPDEQCPGFDLYVRNRSAAP